MHICTHIIIMRLYAIDLFVIRSEERRLLPEYILSMYHVLLVPATQAQCISAKNIIFLLPDQVVPSSENDPTWSYSPSKTPMFDTFFRVFMKQKGRTVVFTPHTCSGIK